jgi:hypothetical protein
MQATPNLEHTKWEQSFASMLAKMWRNLISTVINGHLGFGDGTLRDNIDGTWASVTAPVAPNTDFTITHNLGRVPVGYWVMQKDRACDVYTGGVAATKTQITLRATVASAVLKLFIICLLLTTSVAAQNSIQNDIAVFNSNGTVKVVASALITVCTSAGTGIPCTPLANRCSSQTDVVCNQPNPFNADLNGNFFFWEPNGTYVVTITGVGVTGRSVTYTLGSGSGGVTSPGGSPTQLQYNNTVFGGITGSSYNSGTGAIQLPGQLTAGTSGGVAGSFGMPQGTACALTANIWSMCAGTTVSASGVNTFGPNKLGTAASGVWFGDAAANAVQLNNSGDSNHSLRGTAQIATVGPTSICLAANCPVGEYTLDLHINSTVSCGTPGPATITPTLTYTDDSGTKTNQAIPLVVNGGTTLAATMALGNTTNQSYNVPVHFWSTGVNPISITLTYTACTAGTGTFSYSADVMRKQ